MFYGQLQLALKETQPVAAETRLPEVRCTRCERDTRELASGVSTGYGTDPRDNRVYCFNCIAILEIAEMVGTGKTWGPLFFNEKTQEVTNWPGTLRGKAYYTSTGDHNFFGTTQTSIWFTGPDGKVWYGRLFSGGDNQAFQARRLKHQPKAN